MGWFQSNCAAGAKCTFLAGRCGDQTVLWRQGLLCDGVADLAAVFDAAACSVSKLCNRDVQIRSGLAHAILSIAA